MTGVGSSPASRTMRGADGYPVATPRTMTIAAAVAPAALVWDPSTGAAWSFSASEYTDYDRDESLQQQAADGACVIVLPHHAVRPAELLTALFAALDGIEQLIGAATALIEEVGDFESAERRRLLADWDQAVREASSRVCPSA